MTLKRTKGNLIDLAEQGDFDIIVHGCNCFHAMGGGIAREIATRYPDAALVDKTDTVRGDICKLGTWTSTLVESGERLFTIVNAYTQYGVSNTQDVFEYEAFALILRKLRLLYPTHRFGLPYIGMGLAGGDPNRIMPMIEEFGKHVDATLVEFG